jgi:hypothetical protein
MEWDFDATGDLFGSRNTNGEAFAGVFVFVLHPNIAKVSFQFQELRCHAFHRFANVFYLRQP